MTSGLAVDRLLSATDQLLAEGRVRVASLVLAAVATVEHGTSRLVTRLARAALAGGEPRDAIAALDTIEEEPSAALLLWRARACIAAADPAAAAAAAERALALAPANADAAGLFATLLVEAGDAPRAAHIAQAAIMAGATGPALHAAWAVALLSAGRPDAARSALRAGLEAEPGHPQLQRLLATYCGVAA